MRPFGISCARIFSGPDRRGTMHPHRSAGQRGISLPPPTKVSLSAKRGMPSSCEGVDRQLHAVAVLLVIVWCMVGLIESVGAFRGPVGFAVEHSPGAFGSVGLPMPAAAEVSSIRRLLSPMKAANVRVQVLYPPHHDPTSVRYVQQQLAHLEYPHWVDVQSGAETIPAEVHAVIAAPGVSLGSLAPVAENGGFRLYLRPAP